MEFNQLESFIAVVKYKNFSKAAKNLYLTQPTVSSNIQNLENELNTTLLDRKSKTITLTDTGKTFYKYAVELLNIRDQAKYKIGHLYNKIEGIIEIDASSIPEQYILPYLIRDFIAKYENITFSVNHKSSQTIVDHILKGKRSYGIVGAKYESRSLEYLDFYEDELVLAVPNCEQYSLSKTSTTTLDELINEKFIFRKDGSGTRHLIEQRLADKGVCINDLNIISYIDSNQMIKKMIELKLGVSFMSSLAITNEVALNLIKPLRVTDLNLSRKFYFVYCKHRTLSPAVETFKNFLINWQGIKQ